MDSFMEPIIHGWKIKTWRGILAQTLRILSFTKFGELKYPSKAIFDDRSIAL
jgi:hypothetical protein